MAENSEVVDRSNWRESLDALTKQHEGDDATIEVLSSDLGDQFEAEKVPFSYVEYDEHGDMVSAAVGGRDGRYPVVLRHAIEHPQSISVNVSSSGSVSTVEIVEADGTRTLVTLHPRPSLSA